MDKRPPLTEFQKAIVWALEQSPNGRASRWSIAQIAFGDRWHRKPQGRGALIGNIDRACQRMSDFVIRIPPKDEHADALMCLRPQVR